MIADSDAGVAILGSSLVVMALSFGLLVPAYDAFNHAIERGQRREKMRAAVLLGGLMAMSLVSALAGILAAAVLFGDWDSGLRAAWALLFTQIAGVIVIVLAFALSFVSLRN